MENLDGSPESIMMESMLEGMAQYYSANLSREVYKGMKESAYACTHLGGTPPLGYDVDSITKKYVINEQEAEIVRTIFNEYAEGVMGYSRLLAYLNGMGYKTKRGNKFDTNSLNSILKNEKYVGTYVFNLRKERGADRKRNPSFNPEEDVIRIENGMPAIVSKEVFEKVKLKMEGDLRNGGRHKAKELYLLSGLLFCGECGSSMHGNTRNCGRGKTRYSSYRCSGRMQHKGCLNKELRREYLESYVLDELYNSLFSDVSIARLAQMLTDYTNQKRADTEEALQEIKAALLEVNRQISGIIDLVTGSGISVDTVKEKLRELEERKTALEKRLEDMQHAKLGILVTEEQVIELVNRSRDFVVTKNIDECKKFIESYVDKVLVYTEHVEIFFKINIPTQEELAPLTAEQDIQSIRKNYKVS